MVSILRWLSFIFRCYLQENTGLLHYLRNSLLLHIFSEAWGLEYTSRLYFSMIIVVTWYFTLIWYKHSVVIISWGVFINRISGRIRDFKQKTGLNGIDFQNPFFKLLGSEDFRGAELELKTYWYKNRLLFPIWHISSVGRAWC